MAAQTVFLSKQVRTIVAGRQRCSDNQRVLGAYTLLLLQTTPPGGSVLKEATCMASAFLRKYA